MENRWKQKKIHVYLTQCQIWDLSWTSSSLSQFESNFLRDGCDFFINRVALSRHNYELALSSHWFLCPANNELDGWKIFQILWRLQKLVRLHEVDSVSCIHPPQGRPEIHWGTAVLRRANNCSFGAEGANIFQDTKLTAKNPEKYLKTAVYFFKTTVYFCSIPPKVARSFVNARREINFRQPYHNMFLKEGYQDSHPFLAEACGEALGLTQIFGRFFSPPSLKCM